MTVLAVILVLISSILLVFRDFLTKRLHGDKQIFVWWFTILSIVFILPIVIYLMITQGFPSLPGILLGMGVGFIHCCYWIFYSKAYEGGDLSHVFPIMRAAPALVLIFAILFLQEKVSALGVGGICAVSVGVYLISLKGWTAKALFEPFTSIFRDRHVQFAFLALLTVTAYSICDKIGVSYLHPIIYAFFISLSASIFFTLYILKRKKWTDIMAVWQKDTKAVVYNAIISAVNYPLILIALTFSKVSYVVGFRQMSVVFAAFLGGRILKEQHQSIRLIATIIIFLGAMMISVG